MTTALNLALNGLSNAATRAANAVSNIVKASSTGNLDSALVTLQESAVDYKASANVIKTVEKTQKSLLDIKV